MCGTFERKETWFLRNEKKKPIYAHDTATKNGQSHHWNKDKNESKGLHDLFLETLFWINLCLAKN